MSDDLDPKLFPQRHVPREEDDRPAAVAQSASRNAIDAIRAEIAAVLDRHREATSPGERRHAVLVALMDELDR